MTPLDSFTLYNPIVGEKEMHHISLWLNDLPFYVKVSLRKKQWKKLVKNVDAGRGKIQKIEKKNIYLENVGFQVFEKTKRTSGDI